MAKIISLEDDQILNIICHQITTSNYDLNTNDVALVNTTKMYKNILLAEVVLTSFNSGLVV